MNANEACHKTSEYPFKSSFGANLINQLNRDREG